MVLLDIRGIVLDTNVIAELMKANGSYAVLDWIERFPPTDLYITVVSQAEILSGIAMLPIGRRRSGLERAACGMFLDDFPKRILSFAENAVPHYADIVAARRRAGRHSSPLDTMIAAIARASGAAVATRNVSDFEGCGVEILDPWSEV